MKAHQRSCNVLDLPELRSLFQQPFIDEFIEREIESAETIEEQIIDNSNLPDSEPLGKCHFYREGGPLEIFQVL